MNPGRCGWHDLERVWNADEQRWMCPHYSQAAEVADAVRGIGPRYERESADIEASLDRIDARCRAGRGEGVTS